MRLNHGDMESLKTALHLSFEIAQARTSVSERVKTAEGTPEAVWVTRDDIHAGAVGLASLLPWAAAARCFRTRTECMQKRAVETTTSENRKRGTTLDIRPRQTSTIA